MLTDTAVHITPPDQICWQIRVDDFSVRAANWGNVEFVSRHGIRVQIPPSADHGSGGAESCVAEWPKALDEWRIRLQQQAVSKAAFVPKTELGSKLWALRQRYIAEGGKLYSLAEIQQEVARRRGESE